MALDANVSGAQLAAGCSREGARRELQHQILGELRAALCTARPVDLWVAESSG